MSTHTVPLLSPVFCADHPEAALDRACCRCGDFYCGDCFESQELCRDCYRVLGPVQPNEEGRYLGLSRRSSAFLGAAVNFGMLVAAMSVAIANGGEVSEFASRFFCLLFLAELSFVIYSMLPLADDLRL
ncbi:MAG: hypothetical protein P1V97_39440 [Planctomycetota bacterium]|nr:hypothetical protein [Planctomycetota bacterium]